MKKDREVEAFLVEGWILLRKKMIIETDDKDKAGEILLNSLIQCYNLSSDDVADGDFSILEQYGVRND